MLIFPISYKKVGIVFVCIALVARLIGCSFFYFVDRILMHLFFIFAALWRHLSKGY